MRPKSCYILCAAGITCLFASTHKNPDENTAKYVQAQQVAKPSDSADQAISELQKSATEVADAAVHAEVPSGPCVELVTKTPNSTADSEQPVANNLPGITAATLHRQSFVMTEALWPVVILRVP